LYMVRQDLIEASADNRNKVERALTKGKKGQGLTLTEIATIADLPVSTVKRHLDFLAAIKRVHVQTFGTFNVYELNGVGAFTDKVFLSKDHVIHMDSLTNRFGGSYIRLKESKRNGDKWIDMGAIIVSPEKVKELLEKLDSICTTIQESEQTTTTDS